MKILNVKCKRKFVKYWDFDFLNYKGERLMYCCVAPDYSSALRSFFAYVESAPVQLLGVATDGARYELKQ